MVGLILILVSLFTLISSETVMTPANYCTKHGGIVVNMTVQFDTYSGFVEGNSKKFCRILQQGNLGYIGLDTFGSTIPSLASTYAKYIVVDPTRFISGPFQTNNLNLCQSLGGGVVNFFLTDGGFTDEYGQVDICIFGDDSSVAGWTLLYMGLGERKDIKKAILATPLAIPIPIIPYV